jgi:hypothetical protein
LSGEHAFSAASVSGVFRGFVRELNDGEGGEIVVCGKGVPKDAMEGRWRPDGGMLRDVPTSSSYCGLTPEPQPSHDMM